MPFLVYEEKRDNRNSMYFLQQKNKVKRCVLVREDSKPLKAKIQKALASRKEILD
jgi:hypothetical protein